MWIVWRPGCPDPSRPSCAVHFDDPAEDRDTSGRLATILIAPEHRAMTLHEILTVDRYNLPRAGTAIDGHVVKPVGVICDGFETAKGEVSHG